MSGRRPYTAAASASARHAAIRASRGQVRQAARGVQIAWLPTLLEGRPRSVSDLRWRSRHGDAPVMWLIVVDASASTRRHGALAKAKGLLAELFDQAYRQRARLTLLTASGEQPRWQRQGLKASAALQPWLDALGAGGGTPLHAALIDARRWLVARQRQYPEEQQRCLVVTDARVRLDEPAAPLPCPSVLIDIETAPVRLGRGRALAAQLQADYRHLDSFAVLT